MKKIIYIPLDERPCNYNFPRFLGEITSDYQVIAPPMAIMGNKKTPADTEKLWSFFEEEIVDADGAILSLDALTYGGIVPSRLHSQNKEQCKKSLERLKNIKIKNNIPIYGFNLIMRCPFYSSSDEEPDYYEKWGREIFRWGYLSHKKELNEISIQEKSELEVISDKIPLEILEDYLNRRTINREVNKAVIDYVIDDTLDFLIIPQDDSSPFGLTAIDQQFVREYIESKNIDLKVYMYPGADEVGCILLARMINKMENRQPVIYPKYSSVKGPFIIPLYEDRFLHESVKYQILAAGGIVASSALEADLVLMVSSPGEKMMEASEQKEKNLGYQVNRNIIELVEYTEYVISKLKKPVVVADIAYANGGDLKLIKLLRDKEILFDLAGFAAWNTSSNTLGTCIAQGMISLIYGMNKKHKDFLALRYVEDVGYCGVVRKNICNNFLDDLDFDWFHVDGQRGEIAKLVKEQLEQFINDNLNSDDYFIKIQDCYMPWRRMFEVGLEISIENIYLK